MSGFRVGLECWLASERPRGRLGVVTNSSARDREGRHLVDRLVGRAGVTLAAIFTPEHGLFADAPDGEAVASTRHPVYGIPVISLYGERHAPRPEEIAGLDRLVFDIQDVGVRFYTYVSTLGEVMAAAAAGGVPLTVLDRPNPLGGEVVEGPDREAGFTSFVGHLPIPLRFGLTMGELAIYLQQTLYPDCDLSVERLEGYSRDTGWPAGWPWFRPSPSMPSPATAVFYPGTCLFEGTNLSEGRGSPWPFQAFGAPWIDAPAWLAEVRDRLPPGVKIETVEFVPTFGKFVGERCRGLRVANDGRPFAGAVAVGLHLLAGVLAVSGERLEFARRWPDRPPFFDLLAGCSWLREGLLARTPVDTLVARAEASAAGFAAARRRAWLY